ncbi:hypothetical protein [Acinetobacter sp. MB5]|uniref:hypothetical protein n=1 Tax=Acinetobacter sp. MB5 TaxID=2069438 RepID=UPI001D0DB40B|nr:hypothetical protein [Acinetobacter sp. MB5]
MATLLLGCSVSISSFAGQNSFKVANVTALNQKVMEITNQYLQRGNVILKSIDPHATNLTAQQQQQLCTNTQSYFNNFYDLMNQNRNLLKPEIKTLNRDQFKGLFLNQAGVQSKLQQVGCHLV